MRFVALLLLIAPACALAQTTPKPPMPAHPGAGPTHPPAKPPLHPTPQPGAAHPSSKPAVHQAGKPPAKPAPPKPAPVPQPVPAVEPPPAEPGKGSSTGLPLPRFAALRSDDVNFRSGPGTRYPIDWVYKRRDLPVEIEREFEIWRLVQDPEGNKGWVHQATLTGRRTAVIVGVERPLRQAPDENAAAVARAKPGVILRLRSCEATSPWCQAQIGDYRGFIKRSEIWGVLPDEVIQ